ncbi:MAG: hypothetical protein RLW62_04035 [Gammaproteobacteria bacterium]
MMIFEQLAGAPGGSGDARRVGDRYAQAMDLSNAAPIPPEIVLEAQLGAFVGTRAAGLMARDCAYKLGGAHDDRRVSACALHVGRTSDSAVPARLGCAEAVLERAAPLGADTAPRLAALECDDAPWRHCSALAQADFAELLLVVDSAADAVLQQHNFSRGREECARLMRRPPGWFLCFADRARRAASEAGGARIRTLQRALLGAVDGVYLLPLLLAAPAPDEATLNGLEQLVARLAGDLAEAGLRRAAPGLWLASGRLHRTTGAPLLMHLLARQSQGDYIGIGPLAVSRVDRVRFRNWAEPSAYRQGVRAIGHGIAQSWTPSSYEAFVAELLAALALGEAVDLRSLARRHQLDRPRFVDELRQRFARLVEAGAVAWQGPLAVVVPPPADARFARIVATLGTLRGQVGVVTLRDG